MSIWTVPARVTRVVDGDTLVCDLDLGWGIWHIGAKVRLEGINAPEMSAGEGVLARAWLENVMRMHAGAAEGQPWGPVEVMVVSRRLDKYGRTEAIVRIGSALLNDLMVDAGHAVRVKR